MNDLLVDTQVDVSDQELPSQAQLEEWVGAAVGLQHGAEVSIRIVDEIEGRSLNQQYRARDYATNVLSFPYDSLPGVETSLLGDLVICAPVVAREATEQGKELRAHWAHMVIHGTLHLLGHDHQHEEEAKTMENLEVGILAQLGFPDPYRDND